MANNKDIRDCIDIDLSLIEQLLSGSSFNRIILETPVWLRHKLPFLIDAAGKHVETVLISCDNCWGGCYFDDSKLLATNSDLILHIGHAKRDDNPRIRFIPFKYSNIECVINILSEHWEHLNRYTHILVEFGAEFYESYKQIINFIESRGKNVTCRTDGNSLVPIIGCEYAHLLDDPLPDPKALLYISDSFYPVGALETTKMPVYCIDPYEQCFYSFDSFYNANYRAMRIALFNKLFKKDARIGIVVDTHHSQNRINAALWYKKRLEARNIKTDIIVSTELSAPKLRSFGYYDLFVNTACPRILHYDIFYDIPIVSEQELLGFIKDGTYPMQILNFRPSIPEGD